MPHRTSATLKGFVMSLLGIGALVGAAENTTPVQFQNGDSVCFIGDSITHGGLYHSDILLFYATRFPDRRFETHNCGLSGDSAGGALNRFAWDIEPCKPTVATLMLGMNDVNRGLYAKDKTGEEVEKQRKGAIDGHIANMTQLAERLTKMGGKLIFITPSIYDQTGNQETPNLFGVNDALITCGKAGGALAEKFGGGVVDFNSLLSSINAEWQKKDPSFTIVGGDRVHPGEPGHLLMAYAFLVAQKVPSSVAEIGVDAASGAATKQVNCAVSGVKAENGGVSFECIEKALPFPVPDGARKALEMVPFMEKLNQEILALEGLASGTYEILIDGQSVGERSAEELKAGVNLADNKKTPQWQQAAKVKELNDKRHKLISERLRTIAAVRHFVINSAKPKPADDEAVRKLVEARMEQARKDKFAYGVWQIETYFKYLPDAKAIEKEADDAWKAMYAANQPQPHRYEIRKK